MNHTLTLEANNIKRDKLTKKDFELLLMKKIIFNRYSNTSKGILQTNLLRNNLIDLFIPFLPLDTEHVRQCAVKEFELRALELDIKNHNNFDINRTASLILDRLFFTPNGYFKYSTSGCKRIAHLVGRH